MATTPLTLVESTSATSLYEAAETSEVAAKTSAVRPTLLFAARSSDALDGATTTSAASAAGSATSPGGSSIGSTATSPSFLPEMPQWKKDLIQRRKTNVARTIGAAAVTPTSATTTTTPSSSSSSTLSKQQKQQRQHSPTLNDQQQNVEDDLEAPTKDLSLSSTTVHQIQTAKPIDSPIETTTKVSKTATTSQQEHAAAAEATTAEELNQRTLQAQNAKTNLTKMPATSVKTSITSTTTIATAAATATATKNSPISSSPLKERAEKFLGGHYTPQAAANKDGQERIERSSDIGVERELAKKLSTASALSEERSLYFSAKNSSTEDWCKEESAVAQSSATSLAYNYTTASSSASFMSALSSCSTISGKSHDSNNAASERRESTSEPSLNERLAALAAVTCLASSSVAREHTLVATVAFDEVLEVQETETTRKPAAANNTNKSGTYARSATQSTAKTATATVEKTNTKTTTATGASTTKTSPQPQLNQSHSKYERERTSSPNNLNAASPTSIPSTPPLTPSESEKKALPPPAAPLPGGKISTKLQNNQFIKNQQQLATASGSGAAKYIRYKTYSLQESAALTNIPAARTGFPTKTPSAASSTTTSAAKKMVAVQEMKKTSQNASHHHRHHHSHHQQPHQIIDASGGSCARTNRQSPNEETTFDPSEDLSYGPGIVSKLRCRYLSLALREQRHCLDTLRRATSLSNLLDRNDHKDDDDELDYGEDEEELHHKSATQSERSGKSKNGGGGILKHSHDATNECLLGKKTTTFQKYISTTATNGLRMPASPYEDTTRTVGGGTSSGETSSPRSRHVKRGNDSLKRARSVEALLCEKSPWSFNALNRNSYSPTKGGQSPPPLSSVTIEDKIHNARTRLILGTDAMPPKRLTSIIDDNERPPREFVKQTLKMFEATANRRGRGAGRTQGKGEVANKVANYKSIIKDQKPAIMFPKPPTSPTKKLGSPVKPAAKPVVAAAADLIGSPVGRKTTAAANALAKNQSPKHKLGNTAEPTAVAPSKILSAENSPDITPRNKLLTEKRDTAQPALVDSPVTALTRKLEKLHVDTTTYQSTGGVSAVTVTTKESYARQPQPQQQQASKLTPESWHEKLEVNNENNDVEGDKAAPVDPDRVAAAATDHNNEFAVGSGGGGGAANGSSDKKHDRADADASAEQLPKHDSVQAGTAAAAISSDLSDDEYGLTKRVSKTALDNISKAGTTQQFKFAGQATKATPTSTPVKSAHNDSPQIPTSVLNASPGKQIGVIRPLHTSSSSPSNINSYNSAQQQPQQHMEALKQQSAYSPHSAYSAAPTAAHSLTSREIEKNRINEMKKTTALTTDNNTTNAPGGATGGGGATAAITTATAAAAAASTSLNTVINTNASNSPLGRAATTINATSGYSEFDAASAQASSNNSPLWALRKKRQTPVAAAENTTMVFNFSNRKEVPDYIENDGVIFRRKRELPKPNESGFVLLTDLTLETSTDTDYDDFSMCPPSPCDVEFENANIVIDGKSSIRQKPKEATFRVQFNDTLTSTFEYPSEASLILDNTWTSSYEDLDSVYEKLVLEDNTDSPAHHHHHHVAVDEIIQLPTHNAITSSPAANPSSSTTNTPTKNILGNLPLDYPNLAMGIMLQPPQPQVSAERAELPQQQPKPVPEQKQKQPEPPQSQKQAASLMAFEMPCERRATRQRTPRPTDLPLLSTTATTAVAAAPTASASENPPPLPTKRRKRQQPQMPQVRPEERKDSSAEMPSQEETGAKTSTEASQQKSAEQATLVESISACPPLLHTKRKSELPRVLHDFKLASVCPTARARTTTPPPPTTTTTSIIKKTTPNAKLTNHTKASNLLQVGNAVATPAVATTITIVEPRRTPRKTPAVLNKPQYAHFLQNDLAEEKSRLVLRTRSNEFHNHNNKYNNNTKLSVHINSLPNAQAPLRQQQPRSSSFSFGSAPLGFYTPVKAPLDNLFQLGVTRAPNGNSNAYGSKQKATTNGNHNGDSSAGSIVGIKDGLIGDGNGSASATDEPESLQYIKPANDDLTIAYSEGTLKTDLLY